MTRFSRILVLVGLSTMMLVAPAAAHATGFGIEPGSFHTSFETSEGVVGVPQASSHPYSFSLGFKLDTAPASSLGGVPGAGVVDQDPTHRLRGRFQVVAARLERPLAAELQKYFVNKSRGVEGMAGLFRCELRRRELAEFAINLRQQFRGVHQKACVWRSRTPGESG